MSEESVAAGAQHDPVAGQPSESDGNKPRRSTLIPLIVFGTMLALALIGVAVSQSTDQGGWEYWLFVVLVYAIVGITIAWRKARATGNPVWPLVRKKVLHWVGVLITFKVIFLMEKTGVMNREAASDTALILLALSTFLAGVHIEWMFMLLGIVLGIMAIAIAYVEQYVVWMIMVPVVAGAVWVFLRRMKKGLAT